MKIIKRGFSFLFLFVFLHHLNAQTEIPKKVLFVGNSYTYFWNLPQNVHLMATSQNIDLKTAQSTAGGSSLGHHWRNERKLQSKALINTRNFDAVILQDHSFRAIHHPDSLMYFGELFGDLIKKNGATPYLYMTWAREWDPFMQKKITQKYTELAEKIGAKLVPVGLAFQKCRELRPDLKLFAEDGSHQSTIGTYLAACVFHGVLTGNSPVGLPWRLSTEDKDGEKFYVNIQSKETALFCQKVADAVINNK